MKIIVYQSFECSDFARGYLAHMDLGNDTYMSFFGPTAEAAQKRANDWYANERQRQARIVGTSEPNVTTIANITRGDGRGMHFAGKVWMVNRTTGHKTRVDPGAVAGLEAQGYVRGGPRS